MSPPVKAAASTRRRTSEVPPHDIPAEMKVLGALLSGAPLAAVQPLTSGDFYRQGHQLIFEAVTSLTGADKPAEPTAVLDELRRGGHLGRNKKPDGPYLLECIQASPAQATAGHYAGIVREYAERRRKIEQADRVRQAALAPDADMASIRDLARALVVESAPAQDSERLRVSTGNRNPFDIAREVADYLLKENDPPRLFAMGTAAVLLNDDGTLASLDQDRGAGWLAYVAEHIDFTSTSKDTARIVAPPGPVMKMLPAILVPELPRLDGVVTAPYLDRHGKIVAQDGYHAGSRLVLRMRGLDLPPVTDKPTGYEVAAAVEFLMDEWLGDFPFDSDADKANAVAELLTITGRQFFPLAPLFINDASASGAGKGLLTTTIALIATGEPPHFMELPPAGEEQKKTITAALLDGQSIIAWDESHVVAGRSLAMILTAEIYSGRILGSSKMMSVRNRFTQIALGNNVEVRGDMKRRVVPCRLVPADENPEHRTGFRHENLKEWVLANRGRLLAAVLTIWRNWDAHGRPQAKISMGSFEHWVRVTGGALESAGIKGFGTSTAQWLSYSEDEDDWAGHLSQVRRRWPGSWVTISDIADACQAGLLKHPPIKRDESRPLASQIAYAYRGQRQTPHGGLYLVRSAERDSAAGSYTWTVRQRAQDPETSAAAASGPETSPVSPVRPVFAGRAAFESTGDSPGDRSISSGHPTASPVSPVDLQSQPRVNVAGQGLSTGDTGDTGDRRDLAENEKNETGWAVGSIGFVENSR